MFCPFIPPSLLNLRNYKSFSISIILVFQNTIVGLLEHKTFQIGYFHLVMCEFSSIFYHALRFFSSGLNNIPLPVCNSLVISSPTKEHSSWFGVLAIINKASIDIHAPLLCQHKFSTFWVNIKKFNCWSTWKEYVYPCRKLTNCLQSDCTILCSHWAWTRVSVTPHPHQHLVSY